MRRPRSLIALLGSAAVLLLTAAPAYAQLAPPPPLSGGGSPANPNTGNQGTPPGADGVGTGTNPGGGANPAGPNVPGTGTSAGPGAGTPSDTEQKLNQAEKEDSGRGFELLWARAEAGLSYMNMSSFSADNLGLKQEGSTGALLGIGAGLRFYILSLGVRFRHHQMKVNTEQLNLVLGLHIPISSVDIQFDFHGGYMFVGKLSGAALDLSTSSAPPDAASGVSARGLNAGLGVALDYYIVPQFSIGAGFGADFIYLKRPPAEIPADTPEPVRTQLMNDPLYQKSGDTAGFGLNGGLRLGVHLDL